VSWGGAFVRRIIWAASPLDDILSKEMEKCLTWRNISVEQFVDLPSGVPIETTGYNIALIG
jgi:hypothetical protein